MEQIQAYNSAINLQVMGQVRKGRSGEKLFFVGHRAQHVSYAWFLSNLMQLAHHTDYVIPFFVDDSIVRDQLLVYRFLLHPHGVEHVATVFQLALPVGFSENT